MKRYICDHSNKKWKINFDLRGIKFEISLKVTKISIKIVRKIKSTYGVGVPPAKNNRIKPSCMVNLGKVIMLYFR